MPNAVAEQNPTAIKGSWFHALAAGKVLNETEGRSIERGLSERLPRELLPLPQAALNACWDEMNTEIELFNPEGQLVETEFAATVGELWPKDFFIEPLHPDEVVTSRLDRAMFKVSQGQLFIHIVDYKTKKAEKLYALKRRDHNDSQAALNIAILQARFPGAKVFFSHCRVSMAPPHKWDLKRIKPPSEILRGVGVECEQAIIREQQILADPKRQALAYEGYFRGACDGSYGGWPCSWIDACFASRREGELVSLRDRRIKKSLDTES